MNLDFNAISAMLQLLGKPKAGTDPESSASGLQKSASEFAKVNGIGEKIDISARKQQPSASNPVASVLESLGGATGGDLLSTLMPMLLNMGKKPVVQNGGQAESASRFEDDAARPMQNANAASLDERIAQNNAADDANKTQSKTAFSPLKSAEKFAPISFAGYALISALNRLYCHAHT